MIRVIDSKEVVNFLLEGRTWRTTAPMKDIMCVRSYVLRCKLPYKLVQRPQPDGSYILSLEPRDVQGR